VHPGPPSQNRSARASPQPKSRGRRQRSSSSEEHATWRKQDRHASRSRSRSREPRGNQGASPQPKQRGRRQRDQSRDKQKALCGRDRHSSRRSPSPSARLSRWGASPSSGIDTSTLKAQLMADRDDCIKRDFVLAVVPWHPDLTGGMLRSRFLKQVRDDALQHTQAHAPLLCPGRHAVGGQRCVCGVQCWGTRSTVSVECGVGGTVACGVGGTRSTVSVACGVGLTHCACV
jgi:hypothetical protein